MTVSVVIMNSIPTVILIFGSAFATRLFVESIRICRIVHASDGGGKEMGDIATTNKGEITIEQINTHHTSHCMANIAIILRFNLLCVAN